LHPSHGRSSSPARRSVSPRMENEHLSAEEVAAYIDGVVSDVERGRIEAHLARCQRCFTELVELLHHSRRWGRRRPH
jgi:Predicted transmembrane transcriptional regulator (anti-sigma factor)